MFIMNCAQKTTTRRGVKNPSAHVFPVVLVLVGLVQFLAMKMIFAYRRAGGHLGEMSTLERRCPLAGPEQNVQRLFTEGCSQI